MSEQDEGRHRHATDESTDEPDVEAHLHDEFGLQDEAADKGLQDEAADKKLQDEAV
jgi:hypothetical protein